ncbi:MAG: Na+/H+ antiporter NhaC family protein [Puniceicoccaceae bacterium]
MGLVGAVAVVTALIEWTGLAFGAIWPSVAALLLVFTTRNVLAGLLGGALVGAILLADGRLWAVPMQLVENHLLPNFSSPWKSGAIVFTLLLGGFVHLLEKGGILQALLIRLLHGQSRRKVEAGAGAFGLICFFDGLANSLMVGRIFQPLARSAGVSKVRLAYIVDTTSAAVACLAFISTWIAYQLAMIREGFALAGQEALSDPYRQFFASLPHNYYAWFALILMVVAIWRQWNFGPMASYKAESGGGEAPMESGLPVAPEGLWRAWIPVAALLVIIFAGIYTDGTKRMGEALFPFTLDKLALSFSEANVPAILIVGSATGAFLAWLFFPKAASTGENSRGGIFMEGMIQLFQPVLILIMAWMLSSTLKELEAAAYLGEMLGGRIPEELFPVAVFLTGSLVAFTTGTSWGTMGLLMPLAIPLAFAVAGETEAGLQLVPMVIGAVFSGAVFGDHCSPISDTTIVSSIACDLDPMDHVRTQLPYAALAALGAAVLGFMPAGWSGGSLIGAILSGAIFFGSLLVLQIFIGRPPTKA